MKTIMQFVAGALCLLCLGSLAAQRPSPCLCSLDHESVDLRCNNKDGRGGAVLPATTLEIIPTSNQVKMEIRDDPRSLDTFSQARYKAFWIWGDGNFKHFNHGLKAEDEATYKQTYNYPAPGSYNPFVVLAEKKSNKQPPGRTERKVKVNSVNPTSFPPTVFEQRLNVPFKTADIFSTEKLRAGAFHTAVVISAPADETNTGIFFFYNSIYDEVNNRYVAAHVHDIDTVVMPTYAQGPGLGLRQGMMTDIRSDQNLLNLLTQPVYDRLLYSFRNFMFLPIDNNAVRAMPQNFNEYRFFPILETIWADTLAEAGFMTLVVGSKPPSGEFYTEEKIDSMIGMLNGFFLPQIQEEGFKFGQLTIISPESVATETDIQRGPESEGLFPMGFSVQNGDTTSAFLRGVDIQKVEIVGSIDPNELEVLKICRNENGKYSVTMRLEICNDGYMFEDSILVRIKDVGNHFSNIQFPASESHKIKIFTDSLLDNNFHKWSFSWIQYLEGIYDTLSPDSLEYAPRCDGFEFTVETDWAGVQKLQQGAGLEMCVVFSKSTLQIEDCGFNFPIIGQVTQSHGFNCGEPCWCNWVCWLIIILVVLLLLFLWWRWYKKQQDNNNA